MRSKRPPPALPEVQAIGERFAALETSSGGMKQLSVRDTARATIGDATITVDYGRPLARGRVLLGNVVPFDEVWRTGANAATQLTTSAPLTLAGVRLSPGTYTLWTVPRKDGHAELIVNKQFGQWGTEYDPSQDLARIPVAMTTGRAVRERFTFAVEEGRLVYEWGDVEFAVGVRQEP